MLCRETGRRYQHNRREERTEGGHENGDGDDNSVEKRKERGDPRMNSLQSLPYKITARYILCDTKQR